MDLNIKYRNGSMVVHLEEFLSCRNIGKVRKLLKIIKASDTPDEVHKIEQHIELFNENYDGLQKQDSLNVVGYTLKVKFCNQQIDKIKKFRDKCKRSSEPWKSYNEQVKELKEERKGLNTMLRFRKTSFQNGEQDKTFYEKVLEIMMQG